jgi:FKBP-type peptidyl-prolyl cis-trans isomerase SlyD
MSDMTVQPGKYVALTYRICDDHGEVLEQHDLPVGFVYGSDTELIGGMDRAIRGKRAGDRVEVTVPPEAGFGPRDPSLTFTDNLENVPPEYHHIGAEVSMQNDAGDVKTFYVTRIEDGELTVDGNHPLAGKLLTVRVNILEVRDAAPGEELTSGIHAAGAQDTRTIN